jgi:hypothetical protein
MSATLSDRANYYARQMWQCDVKNRADCGVLGLSADWAGGHPFPTNTD